MAITIDWLTQIINIPKADTTLVDIGPPELRSIDLNQFRKDLASILDSEEGMPFIDTHVHTAPVSIGTVTLGRVVEIINGYTLEFEDLQYTVRITGGNSNWSDVKVQNQVSVDTDNSAGLITGLDAIVEAGVISLDVIQSLRIILASAAGKLSGAPSGPIQIRDPNDAKNRIDATVDASGNRTAVTLDVSD